MHKIKYMAESPLYPATPAAAEAFILRHDLFVEQIKEYGKATVSIDSLARENELVLKSINKCWIQFKRDKCMWNPLIVKPHPGNIDNYYTIIGNQRLTCLRAWGYSGKVPCRIASNEDTWGNDIQPLIFHPQRNVK